MSARAIVFDGWHTLFHNQAEPSPLRRFNDLIGKSFDDYDYMYTFERHFGLDKTGDIGAVVRAFLEDLHLSPPASVFDDLYAAMREASENVAWYPEASAALRELKADYLLGLVSNSGAKAAELLRSRLHIAEIFQSCVFSYEVGALKPDPRIFAAVLAALRVAPNEAVFVGDHPRSDYAAALAVGMNALLIDRKGRHSEKGMATISGLSEIRNAIEKQTYARPGGS